MWEVLFIINTLGNYQPISPIFFILLFSYKTLAPFLRKYIKNSKLPPMMIAGSFEVNFNLFVRLGLTSKAKIYFNLWSHALFDTGEEEKNIELKLQKVGMHQQNKPIIYIVANTCTSRDYMNNIVGVCFVGQDVTHNNSIMDRFIRMEGDYKSIVQTLNPLIPPFFASNENTCCSEWNAAMEKLTGCMKHEVLGKVLPGEVF